MADLLPSSTADLLSNMEVLPSKDMVSLRQDRATHHKVSNMEAHHSKVTASHLRVTLLRDKASMERLHREDALRRAALVAIQDSSRSTARLPQVAVINGSFREMVMLVSRAAMKWAIPKVKPYLGFTGFS